MDLRRDLLTLNYDRVVLVLPLPTDAGSVDVERALAGLRRQSVSPDATYILVKDGSPAAAMAVDYMLTNVETVMVMHGEKNPDPITALRCALDQEADRRGTLVIPLPGPPGQYDPVWGRTFVEGLLTGAEMHPGCAVGYGGAAVGNDWASFGLRMPDGSPPGIALAPGSKVHVLFGWAGMAIPREALGEARFEAEEEEATGQSADLRLAKLLYKELVPRVLVDAPDSSLFHGLNRQPLWACVCDLNDLRLAIADLKHRGMLDSYINVPLLKCASTYARLGIFFGIVLLTHLIGGDLALPSKP